MIAVYSLDPILRKSEFKKLARVQRRAAEIFFRNQGSSRAEFLIS
jgi:hypothetical protein